MNKLDINRMSLTDRLATMEVLWESLLHDDEDRDSPNWHGDILKERTKKIESGEATFHTLDELKTRVK